MKRHRSYHLELTKQAWKKAQTEESSSLSPVPFFIYSFLYVLLSDTLVCKWYRQEHRTKAIYGGTVVKKRIFNWIEKLKYTKQENVI